MRKNRFALIFVLIFASFMVSISCGQKNPPESKKDVPDSALTDSIPASGENEYQQDVQPQGRTEQLDSIGDTTRRQ